MFNPKTLYVAWVALSFSVIIFHGRRCSAQGVEILVNSVHGDYVTLGEQISFQGRIILPTEISVAIPKFVGVEDPIAQMSSEIEIQSNLSFEYSTLKRPSQIGIYAFLFFVKLEDTAYKNIRTISVIPTGDPEPDMCYIPLKQLQLSIGSQGSKLNQEDAIFSRKIRNTKIRSKAGSHPATLSNYAQSLTDAFSDYGKRYVDNLVSSPSTYIVLTGTAVVCLATGGAACLPAGAVALTSLVGTSFETDLEILIESSNLSEENKEKVKKWGKLGVSGILSIVGLSYGDGGLLEAVNFSGKFGQLAWQNRPKVSNLRFDNRGQIGSFTIEVVLDDGSTINYTATTLENSSVEGRLPDLHSPTAFKYWDTLIQLRNGQKLLGNVISGQIDEVSYGIQTPVRTNFFVFRSKAGSIDEIPQREISSVFRFRLQITGVGKSMVNLNLGAKNGLKEGTMFQVFRESKHLILHTTERRFVGTIEIVEVRENSSRALITNRFQRRSISVGHYCL
ncbi:MAG: hypothetical protein ACE5HI_03350 [bacterium]